MVSVFWCQCFWVSFPYSQKSRSYKNVNEQEVIVSMSCDSNDRGYFHVVWSIKLLCNTLKIEQANLWKPSRHLYVKTIFQLSWKPPSCLRFSFVLSKQEIKVCVKPDPCGSSSKELINIDVVRQEVSSPPLWKPKGVRSHLVSLLLQQTNKVEVCRLNNEETCTLHHS